MQINDRSVGVGVGSFSADERSSGAFSSNKANENENGTNSYAAFKNNTGQSTALLEREPETVKNPQLKAASSAQQALEKLEYEKKTFDRIKRVFDILGSLVGLVVLSPLFLIISIMILAEHSGKRVFYKQRRLGKGGKSIWIYKFRTMADGADNVEKWLNKEQLLQYYSEYKVEDDPRVTKIGKMLRRTGLDELPQLVNILKGELSIVGPRPIQEAETVLYGKDKDLLLSIRPGLTGYWQAYCSKDTTYTNRRRQKMEIYYVKHRNLLWDIKICFATFGAIVRKAKRGQ